MMELFARDFSLHFVAFEMTGASAFTSPYLFRVEVSSQTQRSGERDLVIFAYLIL